MKKQLFIILLTLLPMIASADDNGSCGSNVTYTYVEDAHTLTISGSGAMTNYTYKTLAPWNNYSSEIVNVIINDGVTSIGNYAFENCSGLTSVSIPNSVTSIGKDAFQNCSGLTSVSIPNSVTSIGEAAFWGCSDLTFVTIPNSVTSIGDYAFTGCSGLTAVHITDLAAWCGISFGEESANPLSYTHRLFLNGIEIKNLIIPDGVTSIGNKAFYCCSGLTSVSIPNSVTSIGAAAFENCSGLTAVHITDLAAWCGISFGDGFANPLFSAHHLFLKGTEIKNLVIPDGVTSIGEAAFENCSGLTSVSIPNSVTSIGKAAFYQCI